MAKRHGFWTFTGERTAAGKPLRFFTGIPARDLAERDVRLLSDEQYATVEASDLYKQAQPPKSITKTSSPKKRATKPKRSPTKKSAPTDVSGEAMTVAVLESQLSEGERTGDAPADATSGKE